MTDWIDDLRRGLTDAERAKTDENARKRRDADMIAERAPRFFNELRDALQRLAGELTEKVGPLGQVTCSGPPERVAVMNTKGNRATLTAILKVKAHQLEVTIKKTGNLYASGEASREYHFHIDNEDRLFARLQSPEKPLTYYAPDELASVLMQTVFTPDLWSGN